MKKQFALIALLLAVVMALTSCVLPFNDNTADTSESIYESNSESEESNVDSSEDASDVSSSESDSEASEQTSEEASDEEESSVEETTAFVHDASHARSIEEIKAELYITDEDFSEAEALLEAFESAGLESDAVYEEVDEVYLVFEEKYSAIDTQVSLATIVYYYNMSDTEASELYLNVYGKFGDLYNAYIETCKNLYQNSPVSAELFADWSEEDIKQLFDYDPRTQELREEVEALQVELNEMNESAPEYNDRAAEIYAQIVTKNNELAKLMGYNNYYEYASVEIYGRDYGIEELETFTTLISQYFLGNLDEVLNQFETNFEKISNIGYTTLINYLYEPFDEQSYNYLDLYIKSFESTSTGEGFHHMFANKNVIFSDNRNSHPTAFQTYVSGEGWDTPICFFGINGQDTSTIVHEMGHYYAALYNENVNSFDLAETQSQANEMLLLAFVRKQMPRDAYNTLKAYTMYNFVVQAVVCVIIDEFERRVYDLESVEGYGSEEFDQIMAEVCENFGGYDYLAENVTDMNYYWRAVTPNNPVYYISYATSMIAALNIYSVAKTDQDAAREIYRIIVEDITEEDTLLTACEKAGLSSPFDEETIKSIIEGIE